MPPAVASLPMVSTSSWAMLMSLAMAAFAHTAPLPHGHGAESDGSLAVYIVAGLAFVLSGLILAMRHLKTLTVAIVNRCLVAKK